MDKHLIWATTAVIIAVLAGVVFAPDSTARGQLLTLLDVLVSALVGGATGFVFGRRAALIQIERARG